MYFSHFLAEWRYIALVISGVFSLIAIFPYINDILRRHTKPNAVSAILWTVLECIALAAQIDSGASLSLFVVIVLVFYTGSIAILALVGYGYSHYTWFDALCGFLCVIAIVLWQVTGNPLLAIVFAILADICATLPTLKKVWVDPESEHAGAWLYISLAMMFGALATDIYDTANLAFPTYMALMSFLIFSVTFAGQRTKRFC